MGGWFGGRAPGFHSGAEASGNLGVYLPLLPSHLIEAFDFVDFGGEQLAVRVGAEAGEQPFSVGEAEAGLVGYGRHDVGAKLTFGLDSPEVSHGAAHAGLGLGTGAVDGGLGGG